MKAPTLSPTRLRSSLARAAATARERLPAWDARGGIGDAADAARWPFERVAWSIERDLIWPLQKRFGDWDLALRAVAAGGVALVAVAAGVAGLLWATPGGNGGAVATRATPTVAAVATKPPASGPVRPSRHVLHGAPPVFAPKASGDAAKVASEKEVRASTSTQAASTGSAKGNGASISSAPAIVGKPAGPAALEVARRFSNAFVLYETGQGSALVRSAFGSTATPALAQSLLRRPPRQPASVKVPKARVLNVVAGPSSGGVYTVSVSLLRVGLTSELRLEMEKAKHGNKWLVTDVLG